MAPSDVLSKREASRQKRAAKKKEPTATPKSASNGIHSISGASSSEEAYWAHNPNHYDDDAHLRGENSDDNHEPKHRQPRRPPQVKSSESRNMTRTMPEVRYASPGVILSQTIIKDRGGGDASQVQPGETYMSPTSNKAGQYQLHPGYSPTANVDYNNGQNNNYNNGNGMNGMNGHPQPHPYNTNGAGLPYYPHLNPYYPQPQPGGSYYYDPNGQYVIATSNSTTEGLNVRGEEVGIVLVVLLLWVGAIILFFNRWGKIRMLEPYQPKFCENHRPSCPMAEVNAITTHIPIRERTFSKFNLSTEMLAGPNGSPHFVKCNYHGVPSADPVPGFSGLASGSMIAGGLIIPGPNFPSGGSTGMLSSHRNSIMMMNHHQHHHHMSRPRQNSVFVTSPSSQVSFYGSDSTLQSSARKTKSAVDLPTLVLTGEFIDNVRRNSKNSITQL